MNYVQMAQEILVFLGGKDNIVSAETCMTRLRVKILDLSTVKVDKLKEVDGVLGVTQQETIHIVFGPGKVNKVYIAFMELMKGDQTAAQLARENKKKRKSKHNSSIQYFLQRVGNIFVVLLPGIVAAGLINGICNVINYTTDSAFLGVWWYQCIRTMGWALFAYLPILVGYTSAQEFGGSGVLGAIAGAMSVTNQSMPLLSLINGKSIVLPFTNEVYNPASGGLLAAMFAGIFFALLEKRLRKIIPNAIDTFFTPLFTLIVGGIVSLLVIQPLGALLTDAIFTVLDFVYTKLGIVGGYILSATFLPLVSVGLHQALTPIHIMLNDPEGVSNGINHLLPILMMAGGGQVGAGIALYFKIKNKKLKRIIRDSITVGILGVAEPMMYAVTLPLGRPFLTACIGSGFGGALAAFFHLGTVSQGVSGIFGLLIVQPGQQIQYLLAMLMAYIGGFVVTYFFGVDEKRINEIYR